MSHASLMDKIYRYQRYFYDVTRPLFLPGRNTLLDAMRLSPGARVLEMGCGTARNLIYLAKRHEDIALYGIDASPKMVETALRSIGRAGLSERITVKVENAENVKPGQTFSFDGFFDVVFFSYSLTMMPSWREALAAAEAALGESDGLFIVDFQDQRAWPGAMRAGFQRWLSLFHVQYPDGMCEEIKRRFSGIEIESLFRGYAFYAGPSKRS